MRSTCLMSSKREATCIPSSRQCPSPSLEATCAAIDDATLFLLPIPYDDENHSFLPNGHEVCPVEKALARLCKQETCKQESTVTTNTYMLQGRRAFTY